MTARGDATDLSRRRFVQAVTLGAAVTAAAGTAAGADQEKGTETTSAEGTEGESGGNSGGGTKTVEVGPGGDFVFTPGTDETMYIKPGTTVKFVWKSNTHNIVVENQPEEANWEGHETIEDSGFEYEHTFEVEGTYDYFCQPHQTSGMTATIEVTSNPPEENTGPTGPQIPRAVQTMGIVATAAMTSILGFAYFFIKYGED